MAMSYSSTASLFRQISARENGWRSPSWRWGSAQMNSISSTCVECQDAKMEEFHHQHYIGFGDSMMAKKKVMVVVDEDSHSRHAMMWALTHVACKGDTLILLHIIPSLIEKSYPCSNSFVTSLRSLCKTSRPEVDVEGLIIQGPKFSTAMSQVKKLEISVLVLGQKKHPPLFSPLINCIFGIAPNIKFVEDCINKGECLTISVRRQSNGVGGYLISTKWQKDFWLLA